jgi:hypothetical protein
MASSGKRKTTMAKLTREAKLRERRFEKDAKKQRRKEGGFDPYPPEQPDPATPEVASAAPQPGAEL